MLKLLRFLKGYRVKTIIGPFFKLVEAIFELITPMVVAWIIDTAIPQGRNGDYSALIKGGVIVLSLGVVGLGFALVAQFFASRASLGFGTNLRKGLYEHINKFSYADLDKFSTASLITRLTSDVNQTQTAIARFIRLVLRAPFIVIGAIVMAMTINLKISIIFVVAALLIALSLYLIMRIAMPKQELVQTKLDDVTRLTKENLSGARVVRAFGEEEREKNIFSDSAESLSKTAINAGALSALLNPLTYAILNLAVIAILYFGGKTVYYGDMTQGEIIALVNYMTQILNAMIVLANVLIVFTKASASAARINEVFAVTPSDKEGEGAEQKENSLAIDIKNLTFYYENSPVPSLEDITLSVQRGESVGILGGTGSGKTTLINLITRLYDSTEGEIIIFGNDIKQYTHKQISEIFGIAPQKTVLFSGTIRDNMQWRKEDATDEEINKALEVSQSLDFVMAKRDGLNTTVAQGGKNLSGGQRQRLTIARALVGSPQILILDDSSSALDFATDAKLRKALKQLREKEGLTVISVSQRVSSVQNCDLIVAMEDGKIAGAGTHEQLIKSCKVYQEIWLSQNKEEENQGGAL